MTPEKYTPDPEKYEKKCWLYQQYWGLLKSQQDVAAMTDVTRKKIRNELDRHGIPTRGRKFGNANANPFAGFYNADEQPPAPDQTRGHYDPEKQRAQGRGNLEREATRADGVSLDWHEEYGAEVDR